MTTKKTTAKPATKAKKPVASVKVPSAVDPVVKPVKAAALRKPAASKKATMAPIKLETPTGKLGIGIATRKVYFMLEHQPAAFEVVCYKGDAVDSKHYMVITKDKLIGTTTEVKLSQIAKLLKADFIKDKAVTSISFVRMGIHALITHRYAV